MIYNEEFETLPREAIEALQLKRLQQVVGRVYHTVGFYRKSFDNAGVTPDDIRSLDDLKRLPFTCKQDLRDNYPFGLFSVPMSSIVRLHASSGTTGKPTVVGYTQRDVETWATLMARSFVSAGLSKNDIIHNAYGYGLFTGGLGAHYGAEKLGASVIPMSGGSTKKQIMLLQDFGPTAICCTPSYLLFLAESGKEMGVDMKSLRLRVGILGAEPWSERMREQIERELDITALDIYGLSEIMGPGVAMECIEGRNGLHINEDHFIVETIDPATGEVLPWGTPGELVFTTLTKEAFPLIRYRTKDISRLMPQVCKCGRTFVRMERVSGRSDDMLIIRGVNVFPSQIESVLLGIDGLEPHYLLIVDRDGSLDTLEVQVEVSEKIFSDEIRELQNMEKRITKDIKDYLGVTAKVKLVEPNTLQRFEGKAQRVLDKRNI
ncbi:MAG: phenylacetate--CoA ligase family protein [Desulfomonilia bacterium]|jgi:phenylacetate-CoA ligase|uniref:Phenylacetyl-CoA ligase n=1 Tax=anaerobic digester metagenome TaxID=1263854 RepID=A0A485M475_9ZZZZ|nr:phenylacetate--CoA ligase [Pseudomonadota bacterium]HON37224.1 phenylacetate--CoA ligase [Deltaproteobacteria bacterium]HRS57117.1 phenylacetate--CoA ligase [Desulfomonilia bacterium]HPD20018.1 phenylacetate--CoA ligase [Deltaproteobacteria bacterium]HPW69791.1 phenylacetate--CoA ligase [Deltaproteobacteria bacterium]